MKKTVLRIQVVNTLLRKEIMANPIMKLIKLMIWTVVILCIMKIDMMWN